MAKRNSKPAQTPAQAAPQAAPAQPATQAAPQVATQAAPVVALRGGIAVALVQPTGKVYRTKAQHNIGWWQTIVQACANGPASVTALTGAQTNPVPAHFVGYCIRRGYLAPATQAPQA